MCFTDTTSVTTYMGVDMEEMVRVVAMVARMNRSNITMMSMILQAGVLPTDIV